MLNLMLKGGDVEALSYALLNRVRCLKAGTMLELHYTFGQVVMCGRGLEQLCGWLSEHRLRFVKEGAPAHHAGEGEPLVESIEIRAGAGQ